MGMSSEPNIIRTSGDMGVIIPGTPIQEFYRGATVLVTGGTGFLGRVLIEKIMRACPHIAKLYLVIRPKKGKDQKQRLKELFDETFFSRVDPSIMKKVTIISGDCSKPMLGLTAEDQKMIQDNVTVVFHVAATVRFDEPLHFAVSINITATRDLLTLAKGMRQLKAFVHVSTAYSNCHLKHIEETFYQPNLDSKKVITLTECLDKPQLDGLTPILLKDVPNTYVYTKAIAEDLFNNYSKGIPTAVVRPSIIIASNKEPVPGWIDSLYGPSGVVIASTTGLMRAIQVDPDMKADVVPVDMVANTLIATAWHLDNRRNKDSIEPPPVFNYVSSVRNPITWFTFFSFCYKHWPHTVLAVWYPFIFIYKSKFKVQLITFFWHYLPSLVIDSVAQLFGKQTNLLKITQKIDKLSSLISYFSTRQWDFHDRNVQSLWKSLDEKDKELFPFDIEQLEWEEYFVHYMRGARQFLLKDELTTIPAGKVRIQRLYWLHVAALSFIFFILLNTAWYWFGGLIIYYTSALFSYLSASSDIYAEKVNNVVPVS